MLVYTGDLGKVFTAGFEEIFAAAHADFFDSFEAIGNKSGTNNQQLPDTGCRELWQFEISVRFQPGIASQSGLERDRVFFLWQTGPFDKRGDGFEALGAITGCVGRAGRRATVF